MSSTSPSPSDSPPSPPSSSPPPSSPPPSSTPPSSPPPSSPPPSSPPPSSPPPSSPPPSSPPPSSPPPSSSSPPPASPPPSSPAPPPQDSDSPPPPPPSGSQSSPPPPPPPSSPPPPSGGDGDFHPPPPHQSSSDGASPPPPPRSLSPSKSSPHSSSSDSPSGGGGGGGSGSSNTGLIVGVAVGAVFLLLVLVAIFVACTKKKKKRPPTSSYYADSGPQGGQYYNHTSHNNNNNWQTGPKPNDHVVTMNSGNAGGGWPMPPPPPPHMFSSDMSSNFSGPHGPPLPPPPLPPSMGFNKNTFTYEELASATSGFAQSNLLGQGGFGFVHKGVLPNGKEVAVKCLKSGSGQGDREFQAEVEIISRVHHRHLVSLVGYCIAGGQKLLVYEFLPNNNLEAHLHAPKDRPALDWATRFKIAMGSAKGLAYLHEDCHPRIIHRDIKTSNILLDFNFEPKVSDFGLAKLSQDNNTHVSTRVMGTFGYLAPEYASSGKLTDKSDVFSFGVMLLELITGRRPVDTTGDYMEDSLVDWARPICVRALEEGNYDQLVDPRLEDDYDKLEMARVVACASASIRHSSRRRPKMSQIVRALEGDVSLEDLNEGVKPGQSPYFSGGTSSSSDYDASSYSADMKKFRKMALNSQNYASSEYGATSEYGLNPSSSSESSGEIGRKASPAQN